MIPTIIAAAPFRAHQTLDSRGICLCVPPLGIPRYALEPLERPWSLAEWCREE